MKRFLLLACILLCACQPEPEPDVTEPETPQAPEQTLEIDLSFMENGAFSWPFESPAMSTLSSSVMNGNGAYRGELVELVMPASKGGYKFKVYATEGVARNSTLGFRFNGVTGDYLELPAILGYYLREVSLVSGGTAPLQIKTVNSNRVAGGEEIAQFPSGGGPFSWTLYETRSGTSYRLQLAESNTANIKKLHLRYSNRPLAVPTGSISPFNYGLREATTGTERYQAIRKAHVMALSFGKEVDYTGVGTVDLEIPDNASPIQLTPNTDFKGTTFHVVNQKKKLYLFSLAASRRNVSVTGAQVDAADYRNVPELAKGLYVLVVQDDSLWVREREGRDYGATRREAILVRDGVGSNGPCAPYDTAPTRISASYAPAIFQPFLRVRLPKTALAENTSPGFSMVPLIFSAPKRILYLRLGVLSAKPVVYPLPRRVYLLSST